MTLLDEILEQPEVAARFLATQTAAIDGVADELAARQEPIRHVVIAARGTSDHAAIYAQYVLGVRHGLTVALATPSVVSMYGADPDVRDSLVIGISQSGASPDIVAVIAAARAQGAPTVAITNEPDSALAAAAARSIALVAGPERAVAATKTYTAQLLAVASLSAALSSDPVDRSALGRHPGRDRAHARARPRHRARSPRTRPRRRGRSSSPAATSTPRRANGPSSSRSSPTSSPTLIPQPISSTARSPSSSPACRY